MKKLFVILLMLVAINANAQWQPDMRLTNKSGNSYTSYNNSWCVASNGNEVHAVWYDDRHGGYPFYEIYYKRSTDGGLNWGADIRLTNNTAISRYPSIAVFGTVVHIVWTEERDGNAEIYYKRSTDGGINWGVDTRLTNNAANSWRNSIATSGSIVHVVWDDNRDGNYEVYYKRSTDDGINWGADTRLTNNTTSFGLPSIAVSGSLVHVVWDDVRDGNHEIYYKRSTDGGINWGADTRLTNNTANSERTSIAVSGLNVHIVWIDNRDGNYEIYYKSSTDSGINWGEDIRLTNNAADSELPSITVSGSLLHVVWTDNRDGNYEIYYKSSTDGGINWNADTRLTSNTGDSGFPFITFSDSLVHILWRDNRDGYFEIYYKRNPTGNIISIQNISTETPSSYSLWQNYPNPFNLVTKIKFSIVSSPHVLGGDLVQLKVYDVMGREVQTLVNESLKPGTYETSFDGSALNSGVYFYKLTVRHDGSSTDGFSETKRMLMIK